MILRTILALASAILALSASAAAEILVAPLRQVITRRQPVGVYEISNASDRIIEGRVGWIDLAATETGYGDASPSRRASLSAAPYLVLSPARFRLEPGRRLKVTVKLKKGAAIPDGERRSHLMIDTAPVRTPLRKAGGGLEVDIGLGLSTPVILRGGAAAPVVSFTQTRLVRDEAGLLDLETSLARQGKYSAFGRLTVVLKAQGSTRTLADIANVAVHVDAPSRRLAIPLKMSALPEGVMTLRYVGEAEYKGRLFAEKDFEIAPPQ